LQTIKKCLIITEAYLQLKKELELMCRLKNLLQKGAKYVNQTKPVKEGRKVPGERKHNKRYSQELRKNPLYLQEAAGLGD